VSRRGQFSPSPGFDDGVPVSRAAAATQKHQPGTEVLRQERVQDRVETAVGVGEAVGRQPDDYERVRHQGLVTEELDYEDDVYRQCIGRYRQRIDVYRQPAGAERRHDHHDEPRHSASGPRRLGRSSAVRAPFAAAVAAATHDASAQKTENHRGVQSADEDHGKDEGEREERAVEHSTVVWIGHDVNIEAGSMYLSVGYNLHHISATVYHYFAFTETSN